MSFNKNIYYLIFAVALLLAASLAFAQDYMVLESARAAGMGGAFLATGDDANAISSNPAGLVRLRRTQLVGSYTQLYNGLEADAMQEGSMFFSPFNWSNYFFGLGVSYFNHSIYREQKASLVIGRELWRRGRKARVATAITPNLLRIDYNQQNFIDFDPNDPIFANGYSKFAFGFDLSFLGEYGPISAAIGGFNLLEPNIAFGATPDGGSNLPRMVRAGASYNFRDYVTPAFEIGIPVTSGDVTDVFEYAFGVETWLVKRMIGARAGLNNDFLCFGLSVRTRTKYDLGFDYAIQIPQGDAADRGFGQIHKVSMDIGMKRPKRVITDLIVMEDSVKAVPELVWVGDTAAIYATIKNDADMTAENFPVTMYYFDETGAPIMADQKIVEKLEPGETKDIALKFAPYKNQYYDLFVSVNDQGDKLPDVHRKVLEWDYQNNTQSGRLACFNPPTPGSVKTSENRLVLSTVSKVREEMPMVPQVFFDKNSAEVDDRFEPSLETIALRLTKNPGITLELRGYTDSETEGENNKELAIARANAVKDRLVEMGVPADRLDIVTEGYDMVSKRSKKALAKDREKIQAEERTVEFSIAQYRNPELGTYYFDDLSLTPSRQMKNDCREAMKEVYDYLDANPDIFVVFHGYSARGEENGRRNAYLRAAKLRDAAYEWVPDWLRRRILLVTSEGEGETPSIDVYMNAEAITYRPRGSTIYSEEMDFSELGVTKISIVTVITDTEIDSFIVSVREENSTKPFAILAAGEGYPPTTLDWNWVGTHGQAPDPSKKYFIEVFVQDKYGQTVSALSDAIEINVREQEDRKELFLISFDFAETDASSDFLEARVENLARRLIERTKYLGPNSRIDAIVVGHTDIVGTESVNRRLSVERAKKEYDNLRAGMMALLGLDKDEELDKWLKEHRMSLSYEGRSYTEPMAVRRFEEGYWRSDIIGDNYEPEGRLVNRRVVLEVLTISE